MELYYRAFGKGYPVLVFHGLYGSSDNWQTIGKQLSDKHTVIIPDLRNHGQSFHSDEMDFESMSHDILKLYKKLNLKKCIVMGHSMGGKLAMKLALDHPERVEKLIIIDVAPKSYLKGYSKHYEFHKNVVNIMNSMDLSSIGSRREAEDIMKQRLLSERTVKFLLKNLKSDKKEGFKWRLNMNAIHRNLYKLIDGNEEEAGSYIDPALFIKGANSDYILENDYELIYKIFPKADIQSIENAGHWVHAEQPEKFLEIIKQFIN